MTTVFTPIDEWNQIPWRKLEKQVFKLQTRIYRASQRGDVRTVRRLQRLLMKSWSAKCLAVRRITQDNQGKKTAGVDGVKSLNPSQRLKLIAQLKLEGRAQPVRRILIPKPGQPDEFRPLGIPTIYDRACQALVKSALEPEWEAKFESHSYGFRPGRSCHDAIGQIFLAIRLKPKYVLDADIAQCFDQINQETLLAKLNTSPTLRRQIRAWLKSGVMQGNQLFPTDKGTPQGGAASPLLANVALHGMEHHLKAAFPQKRGAPVLIRYCDDFVILHEDLAVIEHCQQLISDWLKDRGLELKPSKTSITHTLVPHQGKVGFDFLGFHVQQYPVGKHSTGKRSNGQPLGFKTIITPSHSALKRHTVATGKTIHTHKGVAQIGLITRLRPIIIGWCNYYCHVVCKRAFQKLDHILFQQLRAWGKHRHSNQSKRWRRRRYWRFVGGTRWRFAVNHNGQEITLPLHGETPCRSHVKVQSHRSPFDGDWCYWSQRLGKFPGVSRTEAILLKRQQGMCSHCNLFFSDGDVWEIDHIVPRSHGGTHHLQNKQLLHRHCHDEKTFRDGQRTSLDGV